MRKILKLIVYIVTFIFIFGINNLVYGVGRFVDIPVPPDSSGHTDVTSEEAEQKEKEYEENQENTTNITAEEYVGKSSNNYLKKLEIEGYKLEPEFNSQEDNYTIYVKDKSKVSKVNVIAEAEDSNAKIEGNGNVEISKDYIVNINVIAENGNLKVYTIKIENQDEKGKQENDEEQVSASINENGTGKNNTNLIVGIAIVGVVIIAGILVKSKFSNK